jgi:3-phenylpropionate/trans-cinnamate dioxygenase ferredoxin reductase subunit
MARVVSPPISDFYTDLHARHGVRLLLDTAVTALVDDGAGNVRAVVTSRGEIPADLVVVGIGAIPRDGLARSAGLDCDRGIVVDACSRTSLAAIVAAGDCTARRLADGTLLRLESVQNAVEQARSAASALLGRDRPFATTPWFWSDQYGVKLQMVGATAGAETSLVRGDPAEGRFSVFHWKGDRLVGVESVDRAPDHMASRRLLDAGRSPSPAEIADPAFDLAAAARR